MISEKLYRNTLRLRIPSDPVTSLWETEKNTHGRTVGRSRVSCHDNFDAQFAANPDESSEPRSSQLESI